MTTREATQEPQGGFGLRTQVAMMALALVVLGGFALWQLRSGGDEAAPLMTASESTAPGGELTVSAADQATLMQPAAPTRFTLVVDAAVDINDAYARLVERLRALDGSTPFTVMVVVAEQ